MIRSRAVKNQIFFIQKELFSFTGAKHVIIYHLILISMRKSDPKRCPDPDPQPIYAQYIWFPNNEIKTCSIICCYLFISTYIYHTCNIDMVMVSYFQETQTIYLYNAFLFSNITTACSKSLAHFYIASRYMIMDKISLAYSCVCMLLKV